MQGSTGSIGPSGVGGSGKSILANPYPICKIGTFNTASSTQYYFNETALRTTTATAIRFMLNSSGSDNIRLAL